jgi:hypothetical protein
MYERESLSKTKRERVTQEREKNYIVEREVLLSKTKE